VGVHDVANPPPQRAYRAACPGCGAPVEFRSAQSTHAICAYCHSTVVRDGDTLSRIGRMAEVFDDFSPLQLMAAGRFNGRGFTLVGRLQYKYREGSWNEWHAVFDDGGTGFLSEDNGAFVFTLPTTLQREVPAAAQFRVGATTAISGRPFSVASNEQVSLAAAQGELPRLPPLGQPFAMVELRSTAGEAEVLSIDYGSQPPALSLGRSVRLDDLQLSGLRAESAREDQARQFACPNCGAQVTVALAGSQSITCGACRSIIDLSQGIGAELRHAEQDEPVGLLIPLGSQGQLQGAQWQVVGFQHRMGAEPGDSDEQFGWDEYLLYNTKRGFTFLVDAEDGWSVVRPTTGAPVLAGNGQSATYLGTRYALKDSYNAETTYAAGEFYWQVRRGQKTFNRDFEAGRNLLSLEQTPSEVTWSSGARIDSDTVAKAFGIEDRKALLQRGDALPAGGRSGIGCATVIVLFAVILVLLLLLSRCSSCDPRVENCNSSGGGMRSSGGSFGGFSSGGGHK
jgi:hypothetical protein